MKKRIIFFTIAAFLLVHLFSCEQEEVLPHATQEGKNTFGCLINGDVWVPKGYNGTPKLDLSYDPGYAGGALNLNAYRISGENREYLTIFASEVKSKGVYELVDTDSAAAIFRISGRCSYDLDDNVERTGKLIITNFDLDKAIISGTFEFTLAKPGCDTIRVTEGRFDMKI